ncbi:hypothetical protein FRC03_006604 [Tulasnella sp. 419]|nr:hypothetical protein FRC03_006604 [Tulasnella sp. 419]
MEYEPTTFSADSYFATQEPPSSLESDVSRVKDFVELHRQAGRKVVLVTSGGTTVPLERNVVRFLDNFSAGTRGATSAEYFLKAGYAVIFMHRQFSLQPFSRHYSHTTNPFLELLHVNSEGEDANITIESSAQTQLLSVLRAYRKAHDDQMLLRLTFVTINDYLWLLRGVSENLSAIGKNAMYYLAAAVSDFFLPTQKMSEHKIQSGKGSLHIQMDQVPKILKPLVGQWSPEGFTVSFKLETDQNLLIPKAQAALNRYGHQVVIGNTLHRRKFEVVFVSPVSPTSNSSAERIYKEDWLVIPEPEIDAGKEIEEDIILKLVEMHKQWTGEERILNN